MAHTMKMYFSQGDLVKKVDTVGMDGIVLAVFKDTNGAIHVAVEWKFGGITVHVPQHLEHLRHN